MEKEAENIKKIIDLIHGGTKEKEKELLNKAFVFAQNAHLEQKRMSGEPYFIHPFETAKILASLGMDTQTIVAGLLHDVLEDTKITEEEIQKNFGDDILFLIKGVTKLGTLKYRGHERHVESLRKFFVAMANDLRVVIIKFADRLHNLRTLEFVHAEKRHRIALESIEVYAPLANRLGMGKLKGELEDAAFPYAYPKEYKETEEIIKGKKELYKKGVQIKPKTTGEKQNIKVHVDPVEVHLILLLLEYPQKTGPVESEKVLDYFLHTELKNLGEKIVEAYKLLGFVDINVILSTDSDRSLREKIYQFEY